MCANDEACTSSKPKLVPCRAVRKTSVELEGGAGLQGVVHCVGARCRALWLRFIWKNLGA